MHASCFAKVCCRPFRTGACNSVWRCRRPRCKCAKLLSLSGKTVSLVGKSTTSIDWRYCNSSLHHKYSKKFSEG